VKRSMLGVRACRVTFGFVAKTIGATDGGRWGAAASAAKAGLEPTAKRPGVDVAERVSASPSSPPALAAASASRTARWRRGVEARPAATRLTGAVSVAVMVPRAGCIVNLICAEVRSDLIAA
jgi:hypothetical protein